MSRLEANAAQHCCSRPLKARPLNRKPLAVNKKMDRGHINSKQIDSYKVFLQEKHRPPSKGGNTKALHAHVLYIDGERYSFLALGSQQWVHRSDTVSFEFDVKEGYRNIVKKTLVTTDASGNQVIRGNRGFKRQLRTADTRLPGSRREGRD